MRFRFTIRDLLWLTLVIGLIAGWFIDRRNVAIQRDEFSKRATDLEKLSGLQSELIALRKRPPDMVFDSRTGHWVDSTVDQEALAMSLSLQITDLQHKMGH